MWAETQQKVSDPGEGVDARNVTVSLSDLPTYQSESAKCTGTWTLEANFECRGASKYNKSAIGKAWLACRAER